MGSESRRQKSKKSKSLLMRRIRRNNLSQKNGYKCANLHTTNYADSPKLLHDLLVTSGSSNSIHSDQGNRQSNNNLSEISEKSTSDENNHIPNRKRKRTNSMAKSSQESEDYKEGRRIIEPAYFLQQVLDFPHHELFSCKNNFVTIKKETRNGLLSTFHLQYQMCNVTHLVNSENTASKKLNINGAAVLGAISVGMGESQLEEFVTCLNINPMSHRKYNLVQSDLADYVDEAAWSSMLEAGREEAELAIQNKEVDSNGVPLITVIADGAWSKRSYGTNFNAHSGVACIVGYRTKKILYLGVKNKYCSLCHIHKGKPHTFYKNWIKTEKLMRDDNLWRDMVKNLEYFYMNHYLPLLINEDLKDMGKI